MLRNYLETTSPLYLLSFIKRSPFFYLKPKMHIHSLLTLVSTAVFYSSVALAATDPPCGVPVVNTSHGSYYGIRSARYGQDFFLGMPYAQSPLGNLRYAAPQPLNTSWTGLKNATEYSLGCVGYGVSLHSCY